MNKVIRVGNDQHVITGRYKTKHGYIRLVIHSHPFAGKNGYIFEHRVVLEQRLGRYLLPQEVAHHINGIKDDNRPENLEVKDHAQHTIDHHTGKKRSAETRRKISEKTKIRFSNKRNHPFYKNIPKHELKELLLQGKGPKEVSKIFGCTRKTFYNKIEEFNLREWYVRVKQSNSYRKLSG